MPTRASQSFFGPLAGQSVSQPRSFEMPSRLGPRHCGQSSARLAFVRASNENKASQRKDAKEELDACFIIKKVWRLLDNKTPGATGNSYKEQEPHRLHFCAGGALSLPSSS